MKNLLLLSAIAAASISSASADTLAQWTFETPTSTNNIIGLGLTPSSTQTGVGADIGTGIANSFHATAATAWSIPAGNGSGHSWSGNNWSVNDYFQFAVPTLGYTGVSVSWDQNGSSTGPRDFQLQYSLTGVDGSFTSALSYSIPTNVTWSAGSPNPLGNTSFSVDLSAVTSLNNQSQIYLRVVDSSTTSINGGTVGVGGTGRVDNFTVSASPVPEPAAAAFSILGGLATLFAIRRRR